MWVAVAQRWSPGQDSPSEDRPYALSFLSDAASMSKYFVTNVPRHDSEESINLCTLNYSIIPDYSPCICEIDFSIIVIPRARQMPIRTFLFRKI